MSDDIETMMGIDGILAQTPRISKCPYCNGEHEAICPRIKAVEVDPDGTWRRVEFFAPIEYPPVQVDSEVERDYPRIGDKR